jgi:hypothetical protein
VPVTGSYIQHYPAAGPARRRVARHKGVRVCVCVVGGGVQCGSVCTPRQSAHRRCDQPLSSAASSPAAATTPAAVDGEDSDKSAQAVVTASVPVAVAPAAGDDNEEAAAPSEADAAACTGASATAHVAGAPAPASALWVLVGCEAAASPLPMASLRGCPAAVPDGSYKGV